MSEIANRPGISVCWAALAAPGTFGISFGTIWYTLGVLGVLGGRECGPQLEATHYATCVGVALGWPYAIMMMWRLGICVRPCVHS